MSLSLFVLFFARQKYSPCLCPLWLRSYTHFLLALMSMKKKKKKRTTNKKRITNKYSSRPQRGSVGHNAAVVKILLSQRQDALAAFFPSTHKRFIPALFSAQPAPFCMDGKNAMWKRDLTLFTFAEPCHLSGLSYENSLFIQFWKR